LKKENIVKFTRLPGQPLTEDEKRQSEALAKMLDSEIDTSDIPVDTNWSGAVRGWENRPSKKPVSIRLDTDIIAFFKSRSDKYQSAINRVLREYMNAQIK